MSPFNFKWHDFSKTANRYFFILRQTSPLPPPSSACMTDFFWGGGINSQVLSKYLTFPKHNKVKLLFTTFFSAKSNLKEYVIQNAMWKNFVVFCFDFIVLLFLLCFQWNHRCLLISNKLCLEKWLQIWKINSRILEIYCSCRRKTHYHLVICKIGNTEIPRKLAVFRKTMHQRRSHFESSLK